MKQDILYITREFVRDDVGVWGAKLTDEDADRVIAEVERLDEAGEFNHMGVYWIASRLAAHEVINPYWKES